MNVLITSGGTIEKIDNVRSISNLSTGRLGSTIANSFLKNPVTNKIFYICSKTTILPESDEIHPDNEDILEVIYANSVTDVENAIEYVFSVAKIDIIIHSMAVSDYRVKSITTLSALRENDNISDFSATLTGNNDGQTVGKISSKLDDMVLIMERTQKVISKFKELSPDSILVGFKLLDNVTLETLIDKGFEVLTTNNCSFVLANDLKDIRGNDHIGYLIDRNRCFARYTTKAEIANAIVRAVTKTK